MGTTTYWEMRKQITLLKEDSSYKTTKRVFVECKQSYKFSLITQETPDCIGRKRKKLARREFDGFSEL